MTNLVENIWRHAAERPDHAALRERDRSWSYAELQAAVSGVAEELAARGTQPGDRVLVVLPTSAEFVIAYHAILGLGATAVTVNPLCTAPELAYFLQDAGCSLVLGWDESGAGDGGAAAVAAGEAEVPVWVLGPGALDGFVAERPLALAARADDDPAALLYTSGTTGRPKGAVITHGNLVVTGRLYAEVHELTPDDRSGTALPLFHVFGQGAVMATAYSVGATFTVIRPFDPVHVLDIAAEHRLTGLSGVPTMWIAMLHADTDRTREDFADLRKASSGGAAMPLEVARAFRERFGAEILDGYGLSETTGAACCNRHGGLRKEGSVGTPLPGVEMAVLDENGQELPVGEIGEIAIDGPVVMPAYWNRPDATEAARRGRWFLTGDLGRIDEDGHVFIVDRLKDLVIRGGYNVYPREVEEVLYAHPDVREAAVLGVPDDRLGEEVAAVVAPREGATIDPAELRAWLAERLAAYKLPRIYQFVDTLPKGATGKVLKRAIDRDHLLAAGARPARATAGS